ncbi:hypothetical protein MSG28_012303 [Choristoneura fumiferana]|uniref:Uncharacterized protein n=1 Tax=Choristoneura fumiferana TaxID=7141 RepID=A0ACC0KD93_CHOFU|nr:hypothetical protein MSG28_012303 [Choristoneura fumiferana]
MKLLIFYIITTYSISHLWAQKIEDDQYSFLPQYQSPGPSVFASDSSLYLPLEPHTAIPYYAMKNTNKLPFQYLPPTGTKAPASFPTSFPMMMSSSIVPNFEDDDEDNEPNNRHVTKRPVPLPQSPLQHNRFNGTQRAINRNEPEKREIRQPFRTVNYEHPIDRIDVKPQHFPMNVGVTSQPPVNQNPTTRRSIISVDTVGHRSDHGPELIKAGSYQNAQYFHAPGVFISSSTTEPAIPIIRLSNEMDLDGSFSYEALGADQTHYVQHSRMENIGTDKEEQVVEGSYSYVGDNGQTYTVHYIADSNGFRATGDHLPVAPPMPEIIQRAVQHNLAEEARKPPHLKSWQDNDTNYEGEGENVQRYPAPPQRNLFTGRNPEAFSYSFSPGNTQNNLVAAASSQTPVRTVEFSKDQTQVKANNGPISPQITFLASQGAHVPSLNSPPQSIARVFTTEKSNMPQLMNYEAAVKEADQENNKALWRWQYGINSNIHNENAHKNTISRSSGDEIMINFNDMTPEQYTSMIHSQLDSNSRNNGQPLQFEEQQPSEITTQKITMKYEANVPSEYQNHVTHINHSELPNQERSKNDNTTNSDYYQNKNQIPSQEISQSYNTPNSEYYQNQNAYHNNDIKTEDQNINSQSTLNEVSPAPMTENYPTQEEWLKSIAKSTPPVIEQAKQIENNEPSYHSSKLLTQHDFIPPSQTVTKSYDYEDNFYESRKIGDVNKNIKYSTVNSSPSPKYSSASTIGHIESEITISTTEQPPLFSTLTNIRFIDFVKPDEIKFRPILTDNIQEHDLRDTTTTTETSVEDILENNIFLKNLVRTKNKESNTKYNNIDVEPEIKHFPKVNAEPKVEKVPKYIQYQTKMLNDIKDYRKKTMDLSDIVNFVAQKNQFESNKVKSRNKPLSYSNTNQNNKMIYIPTYQEQSNEDHENEERNKDNFRTLNHQQQEELRGIIKNYKILQRNNNKIRNEEDRMNQLRRDLSPPPVKMLQSPNLPPLGRAGPSMKSYLPPVFV